MNETFIKFIERDMTRNEILEDLRGYKWGNGKTKTTREVKDYSKIMGYRIGEKTIRAL